MSILRPKFITTTFSSKKKKKRDKGESKSFHIEGLQEKKSNDPEGTESDLKELDPKNLEKENEKNTPLEKEAGVWGNDQDSRFDWWPDLSDLDRLHIENAPLEERARLLSAKVSMSIEHTMQSISERKNFPMLDDFSLPENPTRHFPLRLIHAFSSLPVEVAESPVHEE